MVESIVVKILVGMLGVLIFLRISGKTQMAQLTPLDSVNAFVLGALVGGSIYSPEMSVWYLVLALGVWTVFNMLIRFLLRFKHLRRLIKGDTVMIVRDGSSDATGSKWSSSGRCCARTVFSRCSRSTMSVSKRTDG